MVICAMNHCSSRTNRDHKRGIRFFVIPTIIKNQCALTKQRSERRRELWISRINRADLPIEKIKLYTRVCSRHFISGTV